MKHARGKGGRHTKQYQGWSQPQAPDHTPPMGFPAVGTDPADELAMSYAPAQPVYQYPPQYPAQRQGLSTAARLSLAAAACLVSLLLGACVILGVALAMGTPSPAQASDQTQRQPVTQTVIVAGDQIKVKARQLCPTEDSCDIDYEGRGVWTITRRTP